MNRTFRELVSTLSILPVMAVTLAAQPQGSAPEGASVETQIEEIQKEYAELSQQLRALEVEAMQRDEVKQAFQDYRSELVDKMKEFDPDASDAIEEREEVYAFIRKVQQGDTSPASEEIQKANTRFNQLQQSLLPVEQEAIQASGVATERDQFREELQETMSEIDEDVESLLSRRDELVEEYQVLVARREHGS